MAFLLDRLNRFSSLIEKTIFSTNDQELDMDFAFTQIHQLLEKVIAEQKKVFVIGNGGSCGIASHHVVDLVNVVKAPAFTLADNNLLTCMANDYGYHTSFSKPLKCMANQDDLLIAISSSGQSKNILDACEVMKEKKGHVITLSGFKANNPLRKLGNLNIWTDEQDYGLVETAHFFILHSIVDSWAHKLSKQNLLQGAASL